MTNGWFDVDRTLAEMDAFRRQFDDLWGAIETGRGLSGQHGLQHLGWSAWPEAAVYDAGEELVLVADVPGLAAEDVDLQVTKAGLTLSGERKVESPQGYKIHRQERRAYKFARSFSFPVKIDPDRVTAEVKNGVLTVSLPKAPEVQPRRIAVKS